MTYIKQNKFALLEIENISLNFHSFSPTWVSYTDLLLNESSPTQIKPISSKIDCHYNIYLFRSQFITTLSMFENQKIGKIVEHIFRHLGTFSRSRKSFKNDPTMSVSNVILDTKPC